MVYIEEISILNPARSYSRVSVKYGSERFNGKSEDVSWTYDTSSSFIMKSTT